ncbi:MAG TPA: PorP/SprF family type IX secretion system membrane protein, partial [Flavobacteriales bacterium]|nr:PorP/SprF family type IX secretion system membrane protein [Flavobacteriales bacterium]
MKNKILSLTLGLVAGVVSAQDIHFSQFYMAPIQLNPGAAGTEADIRVHLNYKEQWKSVASPYKTIGGSYDMRFKKTKSGYFGGGIFFYSDRAGDARMGVAQGNLNLAYHLVIGQGQTLGLGVMGGYAQRSVNTTNMQWGNQYDGMAYNSSLPAG